MSGGPYHISNDEHGPYVVVFAALLMTYTIFCYLARLVMRFTMNGPLRADDWVVTVGTVTHAPPNLERYLHWKFPSIADVVVAQESLTKSFYGHNLLDSCHHSIRIENIGSKAWTWKAHRVSKSRVDRYGWKSKKRTTVKQ